MCGAISKCVLRKQRAEKLTMKAQNSPPQQFPNEPARCHPKPNQPTQTKHNGFEHDAFRRDRSEIRLGDWPPPCLGREDHGQRNQGVSSQIFPRRSWGLRGEPKYGLVHLGSLPSPRLPSARRSSICTCCFPCNPLNARKGTRKQAPHSPSTTIPLNVLFVVSVWSLFSAAFWFFLGGRG